jgi:hypothetical protein
VRIRQPVPKSPMHLPSTIQAARRQFKACFTGIGKQWPEHFETLEREAAAYMARNNAVVVSVRCWGKAASAAAALAGVVLAVALYARQR